MPAKKRPSPKNTKQIKGKHAKQPELQPYWSVFFFGAAILILALVFVQGDFLWKWIRQNILFGVFGVGAYVLAPALVYFALRIAAGVSIQKEVQKIAVSILLLTGLGFVFSDVDLEGLKLFDMLTSVHEAAAQSAWTFSGGLFGSVLGMTLTLLCGRVAAGILIVVLWVLWGMVLTKITPADLYYFLSNQTQDVRNRHTIYSAERADRKVQEQVRKTQEQEERAQKAQQIRQERQAQIDRQAFERAMAQKKRHANVDIDLGPDYEPEHTTKLKEVPKPEIGPGGTFGLFPAKPKREPEPKPEQDFLETEPVMELLTKQEQSLKEQEQENSFIAHRESELCPEPLQEHILPLPQVKELDFIKEQKPVPQSSVLEDITVAQETQQKDKEQLAAMVRRAVDPVQAVPSSVEKEHQPESSFEQSADYAYPPLSLFQRAKPVDTQSMQQELMNNADLLVKTLESFGVKTKPLGISSGPSVTRYELQPLAGVKISKITGLADDIALNLATGGVRIEAPIPGKAAVGIEIPNKTRMTVTLRSLLESPKFATSKDPLTFAVGKDIAGECQIGNLAKMPHLLIAGTTGSGKSVCTNSIIMSLLYRCSPHLLRMILIDPKMVEFAQYNGIPHLLMPVVTEPRKAAGALGAAVAEMEKRYRLLAENGVPNIEEYNLLAKERSDLEHLPYLVIVIDELADLMMVAGKEVEEYICRIAQKARAAGLHLIIATQRPSVDVITGLIKANIPSRIGLTVMSQIDSRTILDTGGAEKLLGNGDMLYMPVGVTKPVRIQGTFIRSAEIRQVIDFIKQSAPANYSEEMIAEMDKCTAREQINTENDNETKDPMFEACVEVVIEAGQASTSLLQRKCKLGYARAARLIDEMEQEQLIGPYEGAKPRKVLITRQDWIEKKMRQSGQNETEEGSYI